MVSCSLRWPDTLARVPNCQPCPASVYVPCPGRIRCSMLKMTLRTSRRCYCPKRRREVFLRQMCKVVSLGDRDGTARSFNMVQETYYNEHLGEKSRNENVVDLLVKLTNKSLALDLSISHDQAMSRLTHYSRFERYEISDSAWLCTFLDGQLLQTVCSFGLTWGSECKSGCWLLSYL